MKRKKKSGSGGANWMDTYGDMVTLLLCFFVMLFSMSKMDESKWIALVQALNPSAVVNGTSMEEPPEGSVVTQDQVDRDMEQLYQAMAEYFQQENMMEKVSIGKGNGYVCCVRLVCLSLAEEIWKNAQNHVFPQAQVPECCADIVAPC